MGMGFLQQVLIFLKVYERMEDRRPKTEDGSLEPEASSSDGTNKVLPLEKDLVQSLMLEILCSLGRSLAYSG